MRAFAAASIRSTTTAGHVRRHGNGRAITAGSILLFRHFSSIDSHACMLCGNVQSLALILARCSRISGRRWLRTAGATCGNHTLW